MDGLGPRLESGEQDGPPTDVGRGPRSGARGLRWQLQPGLDPDINDDSGEADDGTDSSDSADGTDGADGSDGSDGTEPGPCTHAYHPIHETGWSKSFAATFNGDSGTATEEGLGPVGDDVYAYRDIIATASNASTCR